MSASESSLCTLSPCPHGATDGESALDSLLRHGLYAEARDVPCPALILLDLNLPAIDRCEVQPHDIDMCYQLGASSYMVKPVDFERLRYALELLMRYWFSVVTWRERRSP